MTPLTSEQRVLTESTGLTVAFAVAAIAIGIVAGSAAIVFDGLFSSIEVGMSLLALLAARLVVRESNRRFQYGYWHVEPMALAFNGGALILLCLYGFFDAVGSLLSGGNGVELGWAIGYSAGTAAISLAMFARVRMVEARSESDLLKLESQGWLMSGLASAALLVAFGLAWAIRATPFAHLAPYIDPLVLAVLSLAFLPVPVGTLRRAVMDVLLMTPAELDDTIHAAMDEVVARHGFLGFTSYASRVGRGRFIEIHVLVRPESSLGTVEHVDAIRAEIADALEADPDWDWLTIDFTADESWT